MTRRFSHRVVARLRFKTTRPRDCSRSTAMVSWVGHPALASSRQAAVVLRRRVKPNIGGQKNAHMITCARDDIVRGRRFPGFKQQRHHMVGLKPDGFLMNYGSRQGPLQ